MLTRTSLSSSVARKLELLVPAVTVTVAFPPEVSLSSAALTVTVWGVLQFCGVKVSVGVCTVRSGSPLMATVAVTVLVGAARIVAWMFEEVPSGTTRLVLERVNPP
jgi:hypothetical protein